MGQEAGARTHGPGGRCANSWAGRQVRELTGWEAGARNSWAGRHRPLSSYCLAAGPQVPRGPSTPKFGMGFLPPTPNLKFHTKEKNPRQIPRQNHDFHAESHAKTKFPRQNCFGMEFGMGIQIPCLQKRIPRQNSTPNSLWHKNLNPTPPKWNPTPKFNASTSLPRKTLKHRCFSS